MDTNMVIKWGVRRYNADPKKCWAEIKSLGDTVTPEMVVEYARDPETELHKCFEWDDTKAAEAWRKQQARLVCGSLVVVEEKEEKEQISFRILQHDPLEQAYKPVTLIVRNEDEYKRLVNRAKAELASFRERYKNILELQSVIEEIEKVI